MFYSRPNLSFSSKYQENHNTQNYHISALQHESSLHLQKQNLLDRASNKTQLLEPRCKVFFSLGLTSL